VVRTHHGATSGKRTSSCTRSCAGTSGDDLNAGKLLPFANREHHSTNRYQSSSC
ncbi:unnamed protein product, partial [Heterosigma akashiwo]